MSFDTGTQLPRVVAVQATRPLDGTFPRGRHPGAGPLASHADFQPSQAYHG